MQGMHFVAPRSISFGSVFGAGLAAGDFVAVAGFCLEEVAFGGGFGQTAPVFGCGFAGPLVETAAAFGFACDLDLCTADDWHETTTTTARAAKMIHNGFLMVISYDLLLSLARLSSRTRAMSAAFRAKSCVFSMPRSVTTRYS